MEPKSGSRTIKKSASGGAIGERKKTKQKKKKEKKKLSLKGTESTDVPSPELDSEAPLDGDVALTDQDGQSTPVVGQVTRLPRLNSHSSVSLTTSTPPPRLVTTTTITTISRNASLGGHNNGINSAPTSRSSLSTAPAPPASSTLVTVPSSGNLEGVVARVASLNIKQRSSTKTRSKGQSSKSSGKASRAKDRGSNNNGGGNKTSQSSSSSSKNQGGSATTSNESLRWELALEDVEQERERLAMYKMNRRKRYLAAAQAKGLGWALNYNTAQITSTSSVVNSTPLSEDSGVETATCGSPGTTSTTTATSTTSASASASAAAAGAYIDFSSMKTLRPILAHRGLQEAFVEC